MPPALADDDKERSAVFTAALEQSEQLIRAAKSVGAAARPLPLFYSLSQAGRAITAARLSDPAWRLRGHGLTVGDAPTTDLLRTKVTPQATSQKKKLASGATDAFSGVAAAVGSGVLTEEVELGEIWAAVPDMLPGLVQPMPGLDIWRRPRVVYDEDQAWRDELGEDFPPVQAKLLVGDLREGMTPDEINEELSWYPALERTRARTDVHLGDIRTAAAVRRVRAPTGENCATIGWPQPQPAIDDVVPAYRWSGYRIITPKLGTGDVLAPIMLWWALLLALSSIARYQPEVWVSALNLNDSRAAVPIEEILDLALTAIPELVLQAILPRRS